MAGSWRISSAYEISYGSPYSWPAAAGWLGWPALQLASWPMAKAKAAYVSVWPVAPSGWLTILLTG